MKKNQSTAGSGKAFLLLLVFTLTVTEVIADQEVATSADGFVNAIGIGVEINNTTGDFTSGNVGTVESMLGALGVRHIRTGYSNNTAVFPSRVDYLYNTYGIQTDMLGVLSSYNGSTTVTTPVTPQAQYAASDPAIESVEGLNEPDLEIQYGWTPPNGTPVPGAGYSYTALNGTTYTDGPVTYNSNSYPATQAFQNDFYTKLNGAKPMLSSAMLAPALSQFLGDAPYSLNIEALHNYPDGFLPSGNTLGNSSIPGVDLLSPSSGPLLPLIATETGYQTATSSGGTYWVTATSQAKYQLRLLTEFFNRGVSRTLTYEAIDGGNDLTNPEDNYGIIYYSLAVKPAYTTEQNLISLLKEQTWSTSSKTWSGLPDPNFNPGVLDYNLIGAPPCVHHLLLQKSNGAFYLLIWQEVLSCDCWDGQPNTDITPSSPAYAYTHNSPVNVTLTVNTPVKEIDVYNPDSYPSTSGPTLVSTNTYSAPQTTPASITLSVPDEIVVVKLTPATVNTPWAETDIGTVGVAGSSAQVGGWAGSSSAQTGSVGNMVTEGARGDYYYSYNTVYNSTNPFSNPAMSRVDPSVNFSWNSTPPISTTTSFGTRWTGQIIPQYTDTYTFTSNSDGGVVLWVNGTKIINQWGSGGHGGVLTSSTINLTAGQKYDVKLDSWHAASWSYAILSWSCPSMSSNLTPFIISPANNWYVSGAGSNIWDPNDAFHYVYQTLVGDGTITARVATLPSTQNAAKAGVMIYQSVANSNSANACVLVTPTRGINFQYRPTTGGTSSSATATGLTAPYWVQLQRSGNNFSGYISPTGATGSWTQLGSTESIPMGTTGTPVTIGFPVCSRNTSALEPASFDNISITYPTVTIRATTPLASKNPVTSGVFTVTRTGSSSSSPALTVPYAIGGSAINGTDYSTLSGSVTIPAGAASTTISVTPLNGQFYPANATVKLTLQSGTGYNLGATASDTVTIPSMNVVDNFSSGNTTNWVTQSQSSVSIVTTPVDPGNTYALKWLFNWQGQNGLDSNSYIQYNFASGSPQDWSRVSSVTIRFAADSSNPPSDIGQHISLDLIQNGNAQSLGGGSGVDNMAISGVNGYRTVTFYLGGYVRNQITGLRFFAYSYYSTGPHTWYIDSITTQ